MTTRERLIAAHDEFRKSGDDRWEPTEEETAGAMLLVKPDIAKAQDEANKMIAYYGQVAALLRQVVEEEAK